jgi:bifunctional DNase/RNase
MKRKQLKVMGLSYSQSQIGSYVIVLGEKKGNRKLPVIVKPNEAQHIAVKLENIKPGRPLTHDLFQSMSSAFGIEVYEVFIHSLLEGIFYAKMMATNGVHDVEIECSVGDAIAFALVYKCPIWINESVLGSAGIDIDDDGTTPVGSEELNDDDDDDSEVEDVVTHASVDDLEHLMANAIANEEYEIAAEIRDKIQSMKDIG